ncbi:hypothetical protein [Plebeiibacterium sediminum]|uniref:Uncharacterized protein n=1 Tax=Plebeiibacterium sediminum TaxID=2992112 RepID=A0AAE3M8J4_9BACT|nr:hypothetical protein [Plebeiobacterium sediminum]MCW3788795.1 hypothetical protein [Plebeiobacterium sediminum]
MKLLPKIFKFKYSLLSITIWLTLYFLCYIYNCDIFEKIITILENAENYEIDELILYGLILIAGIFIDLLREITKIKTQEKIQKQRLQTMQATLSTVQDIVGNSFNGLQLIKVKIDMGEKLTKEDLQSFDQIIFDTSGKIAALRNLEKVDFKNITMKHIGLKTEGVHSQKL